MKTRMLDAQHVDGAHEMSPEQAMERTFEIKRNPISQKDQKLKLGGVPMLIRMMNKACRHKSFRKINLNL